MNVSSETSHKRNVDIKEGTILLYHGKKEYAVLFIKKNPNGSFVTLWNDGLIYDSTPLELA